MTAYAITPVMGIDITATSSLASGSLTVYVPEYGLGSTVKMSDGESIYVKAASAITAGDVIQITMSTGSATGITTLLCDANTTTAGQLIAVAHTTLASGQHGWACRAGVPTAGINVAASCVKGSPLYTTTTAGQVDDTSSSAHLIAGMELTATATGAAVTAGLCAYPQLISGTVNNT
jgi:predicted RecA/RadA family phage recombinase